MKSAGFNCSGSHLQNETSISRRSFLTSASATIALLACATPLVVSLSGCISGGKSKSDSAGSAGGSSKAGSTGSTNSTSSGTSSTVSSTIKSLDGWWQSSTNSGGTVFYISDGWADVYLWDSNTKTLGSNPIAGYSLTELTKFTGERGTGTIINRSGGPACYFLYEDNPDFLEFHPDRNSPYETSGCMQRVRGTSGWGFTPPSK